jgi:ankyrin repeat protein
MACQNGHLDILVKLLDNVNTDVNMCTEKGESPLCIACYNGQLDIVLKLLDNVNTDVNKCTEKGSPPLYMA